MFSNSHIDTLTPWVRFIYLPHFESDDFFPEIKMAAQPSRLSRFACMILAEGILQLWLLVVFWNPVQALFSQEGVFFLPLSLSIVHMSG